MIHILLRRLKTGPWGTFGLISIGEQKWCTIERPDFFNVQNYSCIPDGRYIIKLRYFYKGGYPAYRLYDVPDRTQIKIHRANTRNDVAGCIGIGKQFWSDGVKYGVSESTIAFSEFMDAMLNIERGSITIKNEW